MCVGECIVNASLAVFLGSAFTHIYIHVDLHSKHRRHTYLPNYTLNGIKAKVLQHKDPIQSDDNDHCAELHRGMQCNTTQHNCSGQSYDDDDEVDDGAW